MSNGVIDPRIILGLDSSSELDVENRTSHHDGFDDHEHDDFETINIQINEIQNLENFKKHISNFLQKENVLRIKGFVSVEGKPMRLLIQAVGKRVRAQYDKAWGDSPRHSNLVIIAEKNKINKEEIISMLSNH